MSLLSELKDVETLKGDVSDIVSEMKTLLTDGKEKLSGFRDSLKTAMDGAVKAAEAMVSEAKDFGGTGLSGTQNP